MYVNQASYDYHRSEATEYGFNLRYIDDIYITMIITDKKYLLFQKVLKLVMKGQDEY